METLRLSCRADDLHDVFVSWHAGPLSGFPEGSAPPEPRAGCKYRHDLHRRSGSRRDPVWPSLASAGPAQGNDVRAGIVAGDYPLLGVWLEHSPVDCRGRVDANGRAGGMGRDSGALNELAADSARGLIPGFAYQLGILFAAPTNNVEFALR